MFWGWYSRAELNGHTRFRKPLLYPFELREQKAATEYRIFVICQH